MTARRIGAIVLGCAGLVSVYLFQDQLFNDPFNNFIYDPVADNYPEFSVIQYVLLKVLRFVLNDGFAILIIFGLFGPGKYVKFAAYVFLFGFFIPLPLYLILVLAFYRDSYTYLNHLHRIVLNPVLMMLLIPAFYAQNLRSS